MNRFPERKQITEQTLRHFANRLRLIATQFEALAEYLSKTEEKQVATTHWKSGERFIAALGGYAGAVQKAITTTLALDGLDPMGSLDEPDESPDDGSPKQTERDTPRA